MLNDLMSPAREDQQDTMVFQPAPVEQIRVAHLMALQQQRYIYGGTVPAATVAKHRLQNKVARKSRRLNRRGK